MRTGLGITDEVWDKLRVPRPTLDDLDQHTTLYVDLYVSLQLLGMRYPEYMARTTRQERALYGLYMALHSAKEERAMERNKQSSDAAYRAHASLEMPYRG